MLKNTKLRQGKKKILSKNKITYKESLIGLIVKEALRL